MTIAVMGKELTTQQNDYWETKKSYLIFAKKKLKEPFLLKSDLYWLVIPYAAG